MKILYFVLCSWCVLVVSLTPSTTKSLLNQTAQCGEPVILQCPIAHGVRSHYLRITWYKVTNESALILLIRNDENNHSLKRDTEGKFQMDANESLIIHEVQVEDAGKYRCSLRASLGKKNEQIDSYLIVPGCPTIQPLTFDGMLSLDPNITITPNFTCCQGKSVPIHASVLGLLGLNLVKALVSYLATLVITTVLRHRLTRRLRRAH